MKFYVKIHKSKISCVAAIADELIIGKTFKGENNTKITVSEFFYKGELYPEDKVIGILKEFLNLKTLSP